MIITVKLSGFPGKGSKVATIEAIPITTACMRQMFPGMSFRCGAGS